MGHGHIVTHRDPSQPQPEVDQLTGVLVPAQDLIVASVEGLRGVHVGAAYQWSSLIRLRPSYNDIRRLNPGPPLTSSQQKYLSGSKLWFRGGVNVSEQTETVIPGPDGELITIPGTAAGRVITTEGGTDISTEGGEEIAEDFS